MSALAVVPSTGATHGPRLEVDLSAIAANTRLLAGRTDAEVMAVVKADGFGHGAADVARTALASGATSLGVTSIDEALALRAEGLGGRILSWLNPLDASYGAALAADVDLAVPSREHLDAVLRVASLQRPARVHLHLDTGMARDGAEPSAWPALCRAARRAERAGLLEVVGVMGHLGCADDPGHEANALGRRRFAWGLEVARGAGLRPAMRHLAATSATLLDPRSHHTHVRIGAGLVGIDPTGTTPLSHGLTLSAPVVSVRRVRAGTGVGYGHTWTAPAATHLALLPLGYADGLPRVASGRAEVLLRGRRRPVVGRISMDQVVVDLGDEPVRPGETATVLGPGGAGEPTVAEWAVWSDTIEHEVVTGVGSRVHRTTVPASRTTASRTTAPARLRSLS
ncbi:alanine racemase [Nocardioides exalbidus]|uniref:Alanine racemase n=1 Tax=Nocardioides exalbidus TaxID=402596 RepID=A0A1H4ME13_9ACTN|nr:alanine racemase [Nocardioides exalbidus]SEB81087.1 alanine racemase [Nocardioides exalbidus]